jgi:hypothetical protein
MEHSLIQEWLPSIVQWCEAQERHICAHGVPLDDQELLDAQCVGVQQSRQVRLLRVERVPLPDIPVLDAMANQAGLLSPDAAAMSLRYGVFVSESVWRNREIIAHELVHTAQYERLGGFEAFLQRYLQECFTSGYHSGALESEARDVARQLLL